MSFRSLDKLNKFFVKEGTCKTSFKERKHVGKCKVQESMWKKFHTMTVSNVKRIKPLVWQVRGEIIFVVRDMMRSPGIKLPFGPVEKDVVCALLVWNPEWDGWSRCTWYGCGACSGIFRRSVRYQQMLALWPLLVQIWHIVSLSGLGPCSAQNEGCFIRLLEEGLLEGVGRIAGLLEDLLYWHWDT